MMARKKKEMPANPVAVVTGASRGIGKAVALALGEAGCKVIVNYASNAAMADEVVNQIKTNYGASGADAYAMKANIGNAAEVREMFDKINEEVKQHLFRAISFPFSTRNSPIVNVIQLLL